MDRDTVIRLATSVWGSMSASEYADKHSQFADLVLEEAAKVCVPIVGDGGHCVAAIRALKSEAK